MARPPLAKRAGSDYLANMSYFDKLNPVGGFADFWNEFRRPNPYRWPILIASFGMSLAIMSLIIWESNPVAPERPEVTYISTFDENRTDEQILADNIANQLAQEERRAREQAVEERRRGIYRDLGRATGMDVDSIDARIAREEAERAAAEEKRRRELLENVRSPEEVLETDSE